MISGAEWDELAASPLKEAARRLTRRQFAAVAVCLAGPAPAFGETDDLIRLGAISLRIPAAYLFPERTPPGAPAPATARIAFAFAMPDGAPAGSGIEFPPMTRPLPAETASGDVIVLCTRLCATSGGLAGPSPIEQLQNTIIDTGDHSYRSVDGALQVDGPTRAGDADDERFISLVDDATHTGVTALLTHVGGAMYYHGAVSLERPLVSMTMYIPAARIASARACLMQANRLLQRWETR